MGGIAAAVRGGRAGRCPASSVSDAPRSGADRYDRRPRRRRPRELGRSARCSTRATPRPTSAFEVRAYVRTAEGYVFSDRRGHGLVVGRQQGHWRSGAPTPETHSWSPTTRPGWQAGSTRVRATPCVDQQHQNGYRPLPPGSIAASPARFEAIDAGTAYWTRSTRGPWSPSTCTAGRSATRWSHATGPSPTSRTTSWPCATDDGTLGADPERHRGPVARRLLRRASAPSRPTLATYTNDADEPQVYDVAAGERVELDLGGSSVRHRVRVARRAHARGDRGETHDEAVAELLVCAGARGRLRAGGRARDVRRDRRLTGAARR